MTGKKVRADPARGTAQADQAVAGGITSRSADGANLDEGTVEGFGEEWSEYDQSSLSSDELLEAYNRYFSIFPWDRLPPGAVGFDLGCGSGRWARVVAPRVGRLHCIDASEKALGVARKNLAGLDNCVLHHASVDGMPIADGSMDFGYSLGVLHHLPDTEGGLRACVGKLKSGAPFLLYLYYALDNRPAWYRQLWKTSDRIRGVVSELPRGGRLIATKVIAALVYWPLARASLLLERLGLDVGSFPLSFYRRHSFYTMQTDALDRFGTRLEHRFTAEEIRGMMERAGLENITFSSGVPFWCALGYRSSAGE